MIETAFFVTLARTLFSNSHDTGADHISGLLQPANRNNVKKPQINLCVNIMDCYPSLERIHF